MITEDLIVFIQSQRRKNISDDSIKLRLATVGWREDDIKEAFAKLVVPPPIARVAPEPIASQTSPLVMPEIKQTLTPTVKPVAQASIARPEIIAKTIDPYRENPENNEPVSLSDKVWVPIKIAPKPQPVVYVIPEEKKKEPQVQPQNQTISSPSAPIAKPIFAKSFSEANPKTASTELSAEQKQSTSPSSLSDLKLTPKAPLPVMPPINDLPNTAVLHSYQKVLSTATEANMQVAKKKRNTLLKWLLIILFLSIIGGSVFAVMGNYVTIPSFNFSFIKKDPKALLLAAPIILDELQAYKIETTAVITAPSFADITAGLVSGEAPTSSDTDSISLLATGRVNHDSGVPQVFDYKAIFKSSLFKNDLLINLTYNDHTTLVTTPDMDELLGSNAPVSTVVSVPSGQFDSFTALLPDTIERVVEKVDMDKLLSIGVPSYINNENGGVFKDFITNAVVVEKEQETIKGILSYHYELSASREATKKFLTKFIGIFTTGLSSDEKTTLENRLSAVTFDSLDVWIGKEDSKIHQYAFTLKTPLSRLIGLDDKGIAGSVVSLTWKTTYYDFNIHNDIQFPENAKPIDEFLKSITDMKIKDKISSFKPLANVFHNAIGSYGLRSNPTGSCTNPNPSSLFSPVGHAKGASNAVGAIASDMNDILTTTGGALSCYSTPLAWSLSAPLASDPTTSFCIDSTGSSKILMTPLKGVVCQ